MALELFSYGLTQQDIVNLEYMYDERVKKRMRRNRPWYARWIPINHESRMDTVRYMRAWADLLQEEGQLDSPPTNQTNEKENNQAKQETHSVQNN
jgi:hypothetical protein